MKLNERAWNQEQYGGYLDSRPMPELAARLRALRSELVGTMARELEARGYDDWTLQIYTPTGTPSLRGLVKVMAGLTVEETDKGGLRLRRYRPFPLGGRLADRQDGVSGAGVPERPKSGSAAPFQSGQAVA